MTWTEVYGRIEDTLDGDWDGDDGFRCTVSLSEQDLLDILRLLGEECEVDVSSVDDFAAVYEALPDRLSSIWDIIDGFEPGSRSANVLEDLKEMCDA